MWKFVFILGWILLFPLACKAESSYPAGSKLASEEDLPPGVLSEPGESSGIWLGHYKTCRGYAKYILRRIGLPPWGVFLNPSWPVKCKNSHTCHCSGGQYFIEDFRGDGAPVYRCVEPPSAGVEEAKLYYKGESPGLIKFALPRSVCENSSQGEEETDELSHSSSGKHSGQGDLK